MSADLLIRPARPDDKQAVVDFTARIWDGHDYIKDVWDDWLVDGDGPLLVGELDGAAVAVAKLTDLRYGEGWFQGLRVADQARGRGIARALLERCLELSRERGDRALRLMTDADNYRMHGIVEAAGFRRVFDGQWLREPPGRATWGPRPVSPARFDALRADLAGADFLLQTNGLYAAAWRFLELSPARLRGHLERGEVLGSADGRAWALVVPDGDVWLGYAHGADEALDDLLRMLPAHPEREAGGKLRALVPAETTLYHALLRAGYTTSGDGELCYELRL